MTSYILPVLKKSILMTFRIYLSIVFLIYGLAKFWPGQFPHGTHVVYDSSVNSPFDLAWAFFGHSRMYELMIGAGEVTAAILLLIPRTRTLGALIYFPIALNVMMVNYFFEIGVQDLSTVMVVMAGCLLLVDFKKLSVLWSPASYETGRNKE